VWHQTNSLNQALPDQVLYFYYKSLNSIYREARVSLQLGDTCLNAVGEKIYFYILMVLADMMRIWF
jgi:hypothetical protein